MGCDIALDQSRPGLVLARAVGGGKWLKACRTLGVAGRTEKEAIDGLVKLGYVEVSGFVMKRANFLCERCGCGGALQIHHRIFRSHGGTHTPDNLEALGVNCQCHNKIHSGKTK
jgi:hypothetical protein